MVAPDREQSATGHALTLIRPLRMQKVRARTGTRSTARPPTASTWRCSGCCKDQPADLVVLRHQLRPQPGRRRHLLGHGERDASRARCSASRRSPSARRSREGFSFAPRGRASPRTLVRDPARARRCRADLLLNVNVPAGADAGRALHPARPAGLQAVGGREARPARPQVLLDRRHAASGSEGRRHRLRGGLRRAGSR